MNKRPKEIVTRYLLQLGTVKNWINGEVSTLQVIGALVSFTQVYTCPIGTMNIGSTIKKLTNPKSPNLEIHHHSFRFYFIISGLHNSSQTPLYFICTEGRLLPILTLFGATCLVILPAPQTAALKITGLIVHVQMYNN